MKSYLSIAAAAVLTLTITTGCNNDHGSAVVPATTIYPYYGVFATPAVTSGISYTCSDADGMVYTTQTDENGTFGPCVVGKPVVFAMGGAELGQFTAKDTNQTNNVVIAEKMEPLAANTTQTALVTAVTDTNEPLTIGEKVASSVASLDYDGNASNGCLITETAAKSFAKVVEENGGDFEAIDDAKLETVVAQAVNVFINEDKNATAKVVSVKDAQDIQDDTNDKVNKGEIAPPPPPPPVIVEPTPPPTGS